MVEVGLNLSSMAGLFFMQPQPVLAQLVFGANPAAFLGVALAVGGAGLYFMRNVRPQVARDHDIALAAVALLAGSILFFQGWRLDPILTFGCYLLAGAAGFFAFETIRLRGATTEQAKRYSPVVDDERPVSRVYRAELDELAPVDERPPVTRRIRGTRDYRGSDVDDYESDVRRPSIRGSADRPGSSASSRRRRPSSSRPEGRERPSSSRPERSVWDDDYDSRSERSAWDDSSTYSDRPDRSDSWSDDTATSSRPGSASRPRGSGPSGSRPKRPRPSDGPSARRSSDVERPSAQADYVDYQPIDYTESYSDRDADNSGNFD